MLKFTSNVIFLIILATFFIVLFLNHHLNLGYTKEDFSGFSSAKTDYKGETGLKTLVPDNNVYYDPMNANVIHMNSNMVKVLTGATNEYNVYNMTVPADVEAINKLPQTISPSRKIYCYEVVKDEQFLVYIPTLNDSFINIVNVKSNDYMNKNIKVIYAANTELNSIMSGTTEILSLDNTNKLFSTSTNIISIDGDNIKIIYVGNNEAKTFNKNDKTNISNFITKYNPSDVLDKIMNEGICTLYEIIPQQKYVFYLIRPKAFCLMVIDVTTSSNAILVPQSAKTIVSTEPISMDKLKVMNPVLNNSPAQAPATVTVDKPANMPALAPANTPANTPAKTPANTPANTPAVAPAVAPALAPANSPAKTPGNTPAKTPSLTSETLLATYFNFDKRAKSINTSKLTENYIDNPDLIKQTVKIVYTEPFYDEFYLLNSVEKVGEDRYSIKLTNNASDKGVVVSGNNVRNAK